MYLKHHHKVGIMGLGLLLSSFAVSAKTIDMPPRTLSAEMQQIGSSLKNFYTTNQQELALLALQNLKLATENSKLLVPVHVNKAGEVHIKQYQADLDQMLAVIEHTIIMVQANQLDAAKDYAKQLSKIKDAAHTRYR